MNNKCSICGGGRTMKFIKKDANAPAPKYPVLVCPRCDKPALQYKDPAK